jgi:hypothetical protein
MVIVVLMAASRSVQPGESGQNRPVTPLFPVRLMVSHLTLNQKMYGSTPTPGTIALSSNGRTPDFESVNLGSTPSRAPT